MKRENRTLILACMILGTVLSGCSAGPQETEQLFHSDTVVNIPLNPETAEPTQMATEEETFPEETTVETKAATEPTQGSSKATTSTKSTSTKSSSSKTSGSKTSSGTSGSKTTTKATEPPATAAPATEPPVTEPPETQPPVTESVETEPPATEPSETAPPETEPPETVSPEAAIYDISDYAAGGLEYAVVDQINACRAEEGLDALSMSGTLCGIASVRAYEVCLSWSHTRPNGSGWQSVLSDYGYGYGTAAEDLVHTAGFDGAAIVSKWMSSDGSRADILSADFTTIGVGVYSVDGTVFLAAIFVG